MQTRSVFKKMNKKIKIRKSYAVIYLNIIARYISNKLSRLSPINVRLRTKF